ncbi:MAG: 2OG-Fe(II) oxygenase [Caulobacterales bacterium]
MAAVENLSPDAVAEPVLDLEAFRRGQSWAEPYPHLLSEGVVREECKAALVRDFPDIPKPGFFPLSEMKVTGAFAGLIRDFESDAFAAIVEEKLGLVLRDKPRLTTVRKWSALKDGRIHNDGQSKIATVLIYLNEEWSGSSDGNFRVLRSNESFDDYVREAPPLTGIAIGFRRTDASWHGHLPFEGERRVVQLAYLASQEDFDRKTKRGRTSLFLKKLFGG